MNESNSNSIDAPIVPDMMSCGWRECANWLTRCKVLRPDHKANWPNATAVDLAYILRDGVLLCNLLNAIEPNCIDSKDVNQKPQMAQFLCLRNIKAFLSACSKVFELPETDLFEPTMLFDLSNFHKVLCTLSALSNTVKFTSRGIQGFTVDFGRYQEDIYKDLQNAGVGSLVSTQDSEIAFTIKPRIPNDADELSVYHELLNFSRIASKCSRSPRTASLKVLPINSTCEQLDRETKDIKQEDETGPIPLIGVEKRDYVIQELVETERNYTEVLNSLLRHFQRPLASVLRPEESQVIFFGIKELAEIHAAFLSQLRTRRTARDGISLAQVFLDWREKFLIYGDYCSNLTMAQNTLQELCSTNEDVNSEVLKCQQEANNGKFKLRDILSVPMQRILKYHLLLDKLVEETPPEWVEDKVQLEKARDVMVDIAQYINEVKRDSDTLDIIKYIQSSITDWEKNGDIHLKDYGRLLRDGELKVKAQGDQRVKARYVFVFELVFLICKATGRGDSYCYRDMIMLDEYRLDDNQAKRPVGKDSRWSFQWSLVHNTNGKVYTLYARTEEQKQVFIKALQDALDNVCPAVCMKSSHKFKLTTFVKPYSCDRCGKYLKGRMFQGYACETCPVSVHKQCIMFAGRCNPVPQPPTPPPPPPPPLPYERELSDKLWYVGELGREEASAKLKPRENGTYMLRIRPAATVSAGQSDLRSKNESNYALSLKSDGSVKHIRLFKREVDGADLYYLSESRFFKSILELIEYYERVSLAENFEKLDQRLLWPYRRILAKALFDFHGVERNQLSLRKGCRVVVLSKEGDAKGWWKGKIGEQVGFFPKEYVEEE